MATRSSVRKGAVPFVPPGQREDRAFGAVAQPAARSNRGSAIVAFREIPVLTPEDSSRLAEISRAVAEGAHAILVLDGAGWHGAKALCGPDNITLLLLPPYAPELNRS